MTGELTHSRYRLLKRARNIIAAIKATSHSATPGEWQRHYSVIMSIVKNKEGYTHHGDERTTVAFAEPGTDHVGYLPYADKHSQFRNSCHIVATAPQCMLELIRTLERLYPDLVPTPVKNPNTGANDGADKVHDED